MVLPKRKSEKLLNVNECLWMLMLTQMNTFFDWQFNCSPLV